LVRVDGDGDSDTHTEEGSEEESSIDYAKISLEGYLELGTVELCCQHSGTIPTECHAFMDYDWLLYYPKQNLEHGGDCNYCLRGGSSVLLFPQPADLQEVLSDQHNQTFTHDLPRYCELCQCLVDQMYQSFFDPFEDSSTDCGSEVQSGAAATQQAMPQHNSINEGVSSCCQVAVRIKDKHHEIMQTLQEGTKATVSIVVNEEKLEFTTRRMMLQALYRGFDELVCVKYITPPLTLTEPEELRLCCRTCLEMAHEHVGLNQPWATIWWMKHNMQFCHGE